MMQNLELSDEEAAALVRLLKQRDRRRSIPAVAPRPDVAGHRAKLKPEPARPAASREPKIYKRREVSEPRMSCNTHASALVFAKENPSED
jgi:hypothetical protein